MACSLRTSHLTAKVPQDMGCWGRLFGGAVTKRLVCRDSRTELLVRSVESRGLGGGQCVGLQETQKVVRAETQEGQERGWVGKWVGAVARGCGKDLGRQGAGLDFGSQGDSSCGVDQG